MSQLSTPSVDVHRSATAADRVAQALAALRRGQPVLVQDDADRENEADLIASAELIDLPVMAQLIRDCSGIVCLCLDAEQVAQLGRNARRDVAEAAELLWVLAPYEQGVHVFALKGLFRGLDHELDQPFVPLPEFGHPDR